MITEIKFSETLSLWKTEFQINNIEKLIKICEKHIEDHPEVTQDGYGYFETIMDLSGKFNIKIENDLDEILMFSINSVIDLYDKPYNTLSTDVWVNLVRCVDPKQDLYNSKGDLIFHKHTDLNKGLNKPQPIYTFVSYIQLQNNLSGNDGVLFVKDIDDQIYEYLPKIGECIIMKGDLPHVPNQAPKSTQNRIVLAGNVRLEVIKKEKTLL